MTLMKETKDDIKIERYSMFLDREIQCCEYDYSAKYSLQIQYDRYQITNGI